MFPILYHAHHSLHPEDIPFWLEISREFSAPVLELGCGTGRVLLPLASEGKKVIGLDHDFEMLRLLSKNLAQFPQAQAGIIQADFTAFRLAIQFDLVLLTCNTYSTLTKEQRQALLKCVFFHLKPGGAYIASLPNPLVLKRLPRYGEVEVEEVFPHPLDGEPVQVSSAWVREQDNFTVFWHYDHLLPNGKVDRVSTQVTHHLIPVEQYRQEIQSAGFSELTYLGNYDGSEYSTSAENLILITKR